MARKKGIHLIGVGGIGMSGLARLLAARGWPVSGSDVQDGPLLKSLRRAGVRIRIGHRAQGIRGAGTVVYSSSIAPANPELMAAFDQGLTVLHRGQMAAALARGRRLIAVTGAHGKSTTSAMIADLLFRVGWDPMVLLGAELLVIGGNARMGRGRWAVFEADESDNSLLWLKPSVGLVTNIDDEHLDYFRNREEILRMARGFAGRVAPAGTLIGCSDDAQVAQLLGSVSRRTLSYGFNPGAAVRAEGVELGPEGSRYRCWINGRERGEVLLKVIGRHNVLNSLGAIAAAEAIGLDFDRARAGLAQYAGIRRRFQLLGVVGGAMVFEDYGHHPAEVEATLGMARLWPDRRVICVFQPHRYSRTQHLMDRFGASFRQADQVILLPIYAASEAPVEGIGPQQLCARIVSAGTPARILTAEQILARLGKELLPNDLVLFMGAGSVGALAHRFVARFGEKQSAKEPDALLPVG